ncbi:hypothetical protein J437_LFUL007729 [Ladona fulva]|uniref:Homeobox domain-containing protein n=1 Tax=Ladona fulva TaxID=123851 RepID=A0A8K0NY64_LADFU|nr:hypothetical protein J437_LFUL007729 [Ladona fulva]
MQEEGVEVRRHPLHLGGHLHHRVRALPSSSLRPHRVREASPSDPEDPGGSSPPGRREEAVAMTTGQQQPQPPSATQQQHDSSSSSSSSSSAPPPQLHSQQPPQPPPHYGGVQDQAQFEADKRAVYKHPLFPLLALLFERCEQATQSAECPNSESFNMDIQAFVQHQERDRKPFLVNDPEVDGLVQELCKDFCNRYITCLKGKMQSENLLRSDYAYENNNNGGGGGGGGGSNGTAGSGQGSTGGGSPEDLHHGNGYHQMHLANQHSIQPQNQQHSLDGQQGLQVPMCEQHCLEESCNCGSLSPAPTTPGGSADDEEDYLGKKKQKRGVLPKHATSVMRSWLFQHLVHPYPTEDEKRQIAAQTNLTLLQVNNWFINARRRILQPMLDASNPEAAAAAHKAKKAKSVGGAIVGGIGGSGGGGSGKQPAQRFWPENIANLQPQLGAGGIVGGGAAGALLRGGAMGERRNGASHAGLSSGGEDESEEEEEEEDGEAGGEEGDEEGGDSSQDGEGPKLECCSNSGGSGGDSPGQ